MAGVAKRVVIVGAGQAGFQAAVSLRLEGYDGSIALIGDEPFLPYQRPPLSKAYLLGKQEIDSTSLRPESFFPQQNIDLLMGERATGIERSTGVVQLASGSTVPYDKLVLACGAGNCLLPVPGSRLDGVCYLRTRSEAVELADRLAQARNVVIIGGGFIGLEVAAAAAMLGKEVAVIERVPRLMARAVGIQVSGYFLGLHRQKGVRFALGGSVYELIGNAGHVSAVVLDDGEVYAADLVVVGIGVTPNRSLADLSGLPVSDGGLLTDPYLRLMDDNIYAIGDCVFYRNRYAPRTMRIESVQNAVDQARCVAAAIGGNPRPYDAVPWFWTDQFDAKLQMVGVSEGYDTAVTRGVPESGRFSVFYFKENRLLAIDSINRPGDHMAGRKLLAAGSKLTPEQAADLSVDLKSVA
jgi:3-phenylpropionate/trans-cinnamate dioxygenase ferredoxin reductase subunit